MDRRLALGAAAGAILLFLLLRALSGPLGPLGAWALGLLAYWAALGVALWRFSDRYTLAALAEARAPGWAVSLALAAPVLVLGAWALRLLGRDPLPPHFVLAAALGAVANGALGELFWRGALLPRFAPRAAAAALGLFALFHLAWAGAGLEVPGGPLGPAAAALAMGGAWTAARVETGALGASILGHAAFGLFAFCAVAALNHP